MAEKGHDKETFLAFSDQFTPISSKLSRKPLVSFFPAYEASQHIHIDSYLH